MRTRLGPLIALAILLVAMLMAISADAATDTYRDRQWGLKRIGADKAWLVGGGAGATIAIVDTGVDRKHADLEDNLVPGYDFVDDDADPSDENGHGTHVAGIASAVADNGKGIAGVAPRAKIMPIRVLDENGRGSLGDIEDGVHWAVEHGADVVNMSLGDDVIIENLSGGSLADIVNYAWSKGVVPVISAGNDAFFRTELRAAKTLLVTATTPTDTKASYANDVGFAPWGIAAPGGTNQGGEASMIFSTYWSKSKPDVYGWAMGTSQAAPHVAGAAAILRGLGLSPQETVDRLLETARDIGPEGEDFTFGHGRVDVAAAVVGLGKAPEVVDGPAKEPPSRSGTDESMEDVPVSDAKDDDPTDGIDTKSPTASADPSPSPSPRSRAITASDDRDGRSPLPYVVFGGAFAVAMGTLIAFRRLRYR